MFRIVRIADSAVMFTFRSLEEVHAFANTNKGYPGIVTTPDGGRSLESFITKW